MNKHGSIIVGDSTRYVTVNEDGITIDATKAKNINVRKLARSINKELSKLETPTET